MGLFERFPYTNFHELNLDWLLQKVKALEEWAEEAEKRLAAAEATIAEHGQRLDNHDSRISQLEEDVAGLRDDLTSLEERVLTLENDLTTLSENLGQLTERVEQLVDDLDDLEETVSNLSEALDNLEGAVSDLGSRMTTAEGAISDLQDAVAGLVVGAVPITYANASDIIPVSAYANIGFDSTAAPNPISYLNASSGHAFGNGNLYAILARFDLPARTTIYGPGATGAPDGSAKPSLTLSCASGYSLVGYANIKYGYISLDGVKKAAYYSQLATAAATAGNTVDISPDMFVVIGSSNKTLRIELPAANGESFQLGDRAGELAINAIFFAQKDAA